MTTEYALDLGEDGIVIIVSNEPPVVDEGGIVPGGIEDDIIAGVRQFVANPKQLLTAPLRGLGKLFLHALPPLDDENYQLETFAVEFTMGLGGEAGINSPVVTAKVMPEGNFKCTYTWTRKSPKESAGQGSG